MGANDQRWLISLPFLCTTFSTKATNIHIALLPIRAHHSEPQFQQQSIEFSHKIYPIKQKFKGMSAGNIMATLMWGEISAVHSRAIYSNNYSETHTSLNVCPNRTQTIRKMSKYCSSSMTMPSHTLVCAPLRPSHGLDGHVATTTLWT